MKKVFLLAFTLFLLFVFWNNMDNTLETKESIIFFKLDPNIKVEEAITSLSLVKEKMNGGYEVSWEVASKTTDSIYLRQDISLLFSDGILKAVISDWEDNSQLLTQTATTSGEASTLFSALSFHYGEVHANDVITSTQRMSKDKLYVIDSNPSPIHAFKEATTGEQREWKDVLDTVTEQQLKQSWNRVLEAYKIQPRRYFAYPLMEIADIEKFPNFNKADTQEIIGKLWEGIYKEYFLGIKRNGSIIPPIESTMPLIMLAKDSSHLLVLFETKDEEPIRLIQKLPPKIRH